MHFYHFTETAHIPQILANGIEAGVVPYGDGSRLRFVSLTTFLNPANHGLQTGETVHESDPEFAYISQQFPTLVAGVAPSRSVVLTDKTEAVAEIDLHNNDPYLIDYYEFMKRTVTVLFGKADESTILAFMAESAVSGKFPLGRSHVSREDWAALVKAEMKVPTYLQLGWHFYTSSISPSQIGKILYRQSDGKYAP